MICPAVKKGSLLVEEWPVRVLRGQGEWQMLINDKEKVIEVQLIISEQQNEFKSITIFSKWKEQTCSILFALFVYVFF